MSRQLSRDPYARTTLVRERVYMPNITCAWCGNTNHTPKGRAFLYQYRQESDGGRTEVLAKAFCSHDCFRSYHR